MFRGSQRRRSAPPASDNKPILIGHSELDRFTEITQSTEVVGRQVARINGTQMPALERVTCPPLGKTVLLIFADRLIPASVGVNNTFASAAGNDVKEIPSKHSVDVRANLNGFE